MTTALLTHPACLLHDNGPGHPEQPARLQAILAELQKPAFHALKTIEAPLATRAEIARVHERAYIDTALALVPKAGRISLDGEISLGPASGEAALRASGAVIAAVDSVLKGESITAFCAVRPPGHHADASSASGFCLFNNIAIGAMHALTAHPIQRIAIVDFDVHHGNGTQAWAEGHEEILFLSSHQFPLWPGSGHAEDKGPLNNIINMPLAPGSDGQGFRSVMERIAWPALIAFQPELIMISAGFDGHRLDPLANLQLIEEDFAWITAELGRLADRFCNGRIVSTLEGGYNIEALARSAAAHVAALMKVGKA
jgi:acetoin utilization deacetylase AcuC-like enzyme